MTSGAKLARYAAAGVPEVWVVNLRAREVTAYADPSDSEYAAVRVLPGRRQHQPASLPRCNPGGGRLYPACCRAYWGDTLTPNMATPEKKSLPTSRRAADWEEMQ